MKSNEKYVNFFFDLQPPSVPSCQSANFYLNMPGDLDHFDYFDVFYSTYRLVYNMDEGRICGKAEFNTIFLRLRWKVEDFDQIAGWGPV